MKELAFYVLLFALGIAILIPALTIVVCASTLVLVANHLIKVKFNAIINGRPSNV